MITPSTRPMNIMPRLYQLRTVAKPWNNAFSSSTCSLPFLVSVAEQGLERPFRQGHQELDFEHPEQQRVHAYADQHRLDPGDPAQQPPEGGGEHRRKNGRAPGRERVC